MKNLGFWRKNGLFELFCGADQKNGNRIWIPWVRLPLARGRIFSRNFFQILKNFNNLKIGGKIGNPKESGPQIFLNMYLPA